ncbi:hypothetical protein H8E06_00465 [bacterium]|nr:hypothetical protein [bacterium]
MKKRKNKITTQGYFIKRLRDNGFIVNRSFSSYNNQDSRRWTVLVNPGKESVFITCFVNMVFHGESMFELNDGGNLMPKNISLKTDSIEVIVTYLIEHNVTNESVNLRIEE